MAHPKVSAIIPAYNEEKNILQVLKVVTQSPLVDEVIVVNDGSTDKTAEVVKKFNRGVKLINFSQNRGKADALLAGARVAKKKILFFCDADLTGLKPLHLKQLIEPVKSGQTEMAAGSQEHMGFLPKWNLFKRKSKKKKKSRLTQNIGGEKVLMRREFLKIKNLKNSGYAIEQIIINHFVKHQKPYQLITLEGVGHLHKTQKWGLAEGLKRDLPTYFTFGFGHFKYLLLKLKQKLNLQL